MPEPPPDKPRAPDFDDRPKPAAPVEPPSEGSGIVSRVAIFTIAAVLAMALGLIWRATRAEVVQATIYRLGAAVNDGRENFQGFAVAARSDLSGTQTAARLARLLDSPDSFDVGVPECPRYTLGVRLVRGGRTVDALVCLKCGMTITLDAHDDSPSSPRVLNRRFLAELRKLADEGPRKAE
jgi:hypothetical protein